MESLVSGWNQRQAERVEKLALWTGAGEEVRRGGRVRAADQ